MENNLVYIQDENVSSIQNGNTPYSIGELADRIIGEGKKKAGSFFKEFKTEII